MRYDRFLRSCGYQYLYLEVLEPVPQNLKQYPWIQFLRYDFPVIMVQLFLYWSKQLEGVIYLDLIDFLLETFYLCNSLGYIHMAVRSESIGLKVVTAAVQVNTQDMTYLQ